MKLKTEISNVIIFDDMTAYLRNNQIKHILKELVFNRRHYHTSIYFLYQTYKSLEPDIRKLFSNIFLFKVSKKEMEDIMNEIIEEHKNDGRAQRGDHTAEDGGRQNEVLLRIC